MTLYPNTKFEYIKYGTTGRDIASDASFVTVCFKYMVWGHHSKWCALSILQFIYVQLTFLVLSRLKIGRGNCNSKSKL